MSNFLWPHGLQDARLPCPSPTPRACWNSCPSSRSCHPNISSCHPLLLLPLIFPSIRVFSNESVLCIKWPKYWSFSFSISSSSEHSGLISFRIDWLDLLGVQGHISFYCVLFYLYARTLHRYCLLLIESLWQAFVEQIYQCHFPNSILYSGSHCVWFSKYFKLLSLYLLWWSMISDLWCYYCNCFGGTPNHVHMRLET